MKLHQLYAVQEFPVSMEKAWAFLSNPANLKTITPAHMGFNILSGADINMYPGQLIHYKLSPIPGITTSWVTEITHVAEGSYFVDEQRFGPYALWHHKHFIKEVEGGVLMEDLVDYKLPLGWLGNLGHPLIRKQLKQIFAYRAARLNEIFGSAQGSEAQLQFKTY